MAKKDKGQQAAPQTVVEAAAPQPQQLVDFDEWYAARESQIPGHHRKEILQADFRGRGLGANASMNDYDVALGKYGIKLG